MSAHGDLVTACVDYITARGGMATKLQSGRVRVGNRWVHMSKSGWPDVVGVWPEVVRAEFSNVTVNGVPATTISWTSTDGHGLSVGRFIAIEVKTGSGAVRKNQRQIHDELRKRGALVVTVRNIGELEKALA